MPGNQITPAKRSTSTPSSSSKLSHRDVSTSSSLSAPAIFGSSPAVFEGVATHIVERIMSWLPTQDKGFRGFFRVIAATKVNENYESAREGVANGMQAQFLHEVADAEMKGAEAILKLAMVNPTILKKLLTTSKHIIQKNGLIVSGTALEMALKCWDWSSCEGGQEEMAEMLIRYMRMLPDGEQLIQTTYTKLFPNGHEAHEQDQKNRAKEFAESILEPLAKTLKDANNEDIELVYVIALIKDAEVDDYINKNLSENKLWQALMVHHEAIKEFMIKDNVYNPLYLKKAFEIVDKKYEKENWSTLSKGYDQLALLSIHGVGGIQAFSPTLIGMLFARGGIFDYYRMNESDRKKFRVDRNCEVKHDDRNMFARSGGGVLLCAKKFWLSCDGAPLYVADRLRCFGIYMSGKNTSLGSQSQICNTHIKPHRFNAPI